VQYCGELFDTAAVSPHRDAAAAAAAAATGSPGLSPETVCLPRALGIKYEPAGITAFL